MSRRTKLLITALFLVLLSIPAIYLALAWHPPSPLRISLAATQDPSPPEGPPDPNVVRPFYVMVENTSNTPVLLYGASLDDTSPSRVRTSYLLAVIAPYWPHDSTPTIDDAHWLIRPHGSIRCAAIPLEEDALTVSRQGHTVVSYFWRTPWNLRYVQLIDRLSRHAPRRLQRFLGEPDSYRDTTLLEVPPPQPAP